jgi:hypothetical protein
VQAAVVSRHILDRMPVTVTLAFELDHELWCRLVTRTDCELLPARELRGTSWWSYAPDHKVFPKLKVCGGGGGGGGPTHLFDALRSCPRLETRGFQVAVGAKCIFTGCHVGAASVPFSFLDDDKEQADRMLHRLFLGCDGTGMPHVDVRIEVAQTDFLCDPKARLRDFAAVVRELTFTWVKRVMSMDSCHMESGASPMFLMTAADALASGLDISSVRFFVAGVVSCPSMHLAIPWHFAGVTSKT